MPITGILAAVRAAATAISFAAAGALLGGCGVPGHLAVTHRHSSGSAGLRLPITAYQLTVAEQAEASYLEQRVVQGCMRTLGFSYPATGPPGESIAEDIRIQDEVNSRRYGISDPAAASTYGYHIPPWVNGSGLSASPAILPAAEQLALEGPPPGTTPSITDHGARVPQGGCIGQAGRTLLAAGIGGRTVSSGGIGSPALATNIELEAFQRAQSDPRVRTVFAGWSACMRGHSYRYATPFQAGADLRWNMQKPASRTEIQTAETDVTCKKRTRLLGVTAAVESADEDALIRRNTRQLASLKTAIDAEAAAIRRLAAAYGIR